MLTIGSFAFAHGAILAALLLLPLIWWLLRVMPPLPQRLRFPAIALLFGLRQDEDTPDKTPLWLLLLRLCIGALLIFAFAQPLLNPAARVPGSGPILLVVDDGWAAARHWTERQSTMEDLFDRAERDGRSVALLSTAPRVDGQPLVVSRLAPAAETRAMARALQPKPWEADRVAAANAVEAARLEGPVSAVWLSDGVESRGSTGLAERLQRLGSLTLFTDAEGETARVLRPPRRDGNTLVAAAERAGAGAPDLAVARAVALDGRPLGRVELRFAPDQRRAEGRLELPGEIMNETVRLALEGEASASATVLLDDAWRRRIVGIVDEGPTQAGHPLLDDRHYIAGALAGFAEAQRGSVAQLVDADAAVIVLTDSVPLDQQEKERLAAWVAKGGTLLRFAGPRVTEADDGLLPVKLRHGSRALGGALTWSQPQHLAAFDKNSPFAGLPVPEDVTVLRQVLAEPSVDLGDHIWAALQDGTPLVTAAARDRGTIVLFHLTANAEWSNLPISGLFVEMLQRVVNASRGTAGAESEGPLPPLELMDGFGRLGRPTAAAQALAANAVGTATPGPAHPPGYYGTQSGRRAFNLSARLGPVAPLAEPPSGTLRAGYAKAAEVDLRPPLLVAATLLAILDLLASLFLRGHLTRTRVAPLALAFLLLAPGHGRAADDPQTRVPDGPDKPAIEATMEFRLAYVLTGNAEVDATARAGLVGLTQVLDRRTSVEAGQPVGVDIENDEITFYPLLYWAIDPGQPLLSDRARGRLAHYLANGGVVLFDTRDQGMLGPGMEGNTPERQRLRQLLRGLQVPPLAPVPPDHVLTKSFYLLTEFPGRWTGGVVWLDPAGTERNDGVSSVIMGSHDWAAAWAIDANGQARYPVVPGGEPQREMAYRFGVNLVMHVLTGNYKADQVHVPSILQRLGE